MPFEMFRHIIDQFKDLKRLHLQGLGEPLLNPRFFDMVSLAAGKDIEVTVSSNLMLLSRRTADLCVTSGLRCLHVSMDGAAPATYERVRAGGSFSRVLANLALLSQAKEARKSLYPVVRMTVVAMRRNLEEIPALVRLAAEFAMEEVFVQHLCHSFEESSLPQYYEPMRGFVKKESLAGEKPGRVEEYFREAIRAAESSGIRLRLPPVPGIPGKRAAGRTCDWPWTGLYVSHQGFVMPCCMVSTPDRITLGNAGEQTMSDIWNNESYAVFRKGLSSGDPPEICRSCSVFNGTF